MDTNNNQNKIEDEIDYNAVAKTPIRWFGLIYFVFIAVTIGGGLFFVMNLDNIERNSVKPALIDSTKLYKELTQKNGIISAGIDVNTAAQSTPEFLAKGSEVFKANCASCHGAEGKGDGAAGSGLNPKPRNLTLADNWINGRKFTELYKTLEEGIPGSGMAAYEYLPVADRVSVIHYVRSLMQNMPNNTSEELAAADAQYLISKGKATKNQIPTDKAVKLILNENDSLNNISVAVYQIIKNDNSVQSRLFLKMTTDAKRVCYLLMKNKIVLNDALSFSRFIAASYPENGFASSALSINSTENNEVRLYLTGIFR